MVSWGLAVSSLCAVCGCRPGARRLRVSEKFVSYSELYHGSLVCEVCARLIEDQSYRRSSWVLVGGEARRLSKSELLSVLLDPPEGSVIYVKSSGRKYGFLKCLKHASTKTMVALCGEDEGLILVERDKLRQLVEFAREAYNTLKKKEELLNGCSTSSWVYEEVCKLVEEVRGDPAWRIAVRAL
jgi:hypothetical protein